LLLRLTRGLACRFTFIEQQNLKVVEMFFQVDTDGNGELDVWEFEDALVRGVLRSLPARAPADWPLPAQPPWLALTRRAPRCSALHSR
jgi:hypothetical protein